MIGLSVLSRGSIDEKLRWTFNLYDINGDGYISREEMKDVVTAIYELMGSCAEPFLEEGVVNDRVDRLFQVSSHFLGFVARLARDLRGFPLFPENGPKPRRSRKHGRIPPKLQQR